MAKETPTKKKPVSINSLLAQLKAATDPAEKRALRIKLRNAGHTGGLGLPRGPKPGNKKSAKGKAKKKRVASEGEEVSD